jgi:hypothetical protein
MKITFNGHSQINREVELTEKQLNEIFESMRLEFMEHIEFTSTFDKRGSYESSSDKAIRKLCNEHGVDVEYKKDRISFFDAVLSSMKNPYQQ